MSEQPKVEEMNVYQRIHYAGTLLQGSIPKTGKNKEQGYDFVTHDAAVDFVRPALQDARLVFVMTATAHDLSHVETKTKYGEKMLYITEGMFRCEVVNIDKPDDRHAFDVPGFSFDYSDKATGKVISYAKKYALIAMMGLLLPTGLDNDNNTVEPENTPPARNGKRGLDDIPPAPPEKKPAQTQTQTQTQTREQAKSMLWDITQQKGKDLGWLKAFARAQINKSLEEATAKELETLAAKLFAG